MHLKNKALLTLALVINGHKPDAAALAQRLKQLSEKLGAAASILDTYPLSKGALSGYAACCVIGGDGTLLEVVLEAVEQNVPVFGINQGHLGFLATFSPEEAYQYWPSLIQGDYQITTRSLLQYSTATHPERGLALNDIVIKNQSLIKLVNLAVSSNDELISCYSCDGLIFATPTGSTAYNLSAGGPIAHPASQVMLMTPICPHTLSNRSLILPQDFILTVKPTDPNAKVQITLDGYQHFYNLADFPAIISNASKKLLLLQPLDYRYFKILRNKLNWV